MAQAALCGLNKQCFEIRSSWLELSVRPHCSYLPVPVCDIDIDNPAKRTLVMRISNESFHLLTLVVTL